MGKKQTCLMQHTSYTDDWQERTTVRTEAYVAKHYWNSHQIHDLLLIPRFIGSIALNHSEDSKPWWVLSELFSNGGTRLLHKHTAHFPHPAHLETNFLLALKWVSRTSGPSAFPSKITIWPWLLTPADSSPSLPLQSCCLVTRTAGSGT